VLRRDAYGLCLEALLGERFKHPNVVATHAFAVVTGKVGGVYVSESWNMCGGEGGRFGGALLGACGGHTPLW
jgi:hypothetical protein